MAALCFVILAMVSGCTELRRSVVAMFGDNGGDPEAVARAAGELSPTFTGADAKRPRIPARLVLVAKGLSMPTDAQPIPGERGRLVVLEKEGAAKILDLKTGKVSLLFRLEVASVSEQGLLGIAFHPRFRSNRLFYLNHTSADGKSSHIAEWHWPKRGKPREKRVLLKVEQPYQNHNGGQIVFGPEGMLYAGFGDGGWADDPHDNGQNPKSYLGSMLRIDVDRKGKTEPQIFAIGLRNPWRFSFDLHGRLVAGDVGQNKWEEVTFVGRGDNLGWNVYEGFECFEPKKDCAKKRPGKYRMPILSYPRSDGKSITGGYVVLDGDAGPLKGKYVFGDYVSGRIWAIDLPGPKASKKGLDRIKDVHALGKWPLGIASFARDHQGRIYVIALAEGAIYRIEARRPS